MALKVIVVGAGIAGLAGAVSLRRAGHHVYIYERSRFNNEVGAAITIGITGSKILAHLGFDFDGAEWVPHKRLEIVNGMTLAKLNESDLHDAEQRYGGRYASIHRADLHDQLKQLALAEEGEGPPAKLHLNSPVVEVDVISGSIALGDGTVHTADLVVGADGLHSIVRDAVLEEDVPARDTKISAFRFLLPTETCLADPAVAELLASKRETLSLLMDVTDPTNNRRLVWYECRGGRTQNLSGVFKSRDADEGREEYLHSVSKHELLDEFSAYHETVLRVLDMVDDVKLWRLYDRDPLRTWVRGKAVLIGDSAHPMLPYKGQAGTQAIEDAGALGYLLRHLPSDQDIPERLQLFMKVRYDRASVIQILSSVNPGQEHLVTDELQKYPDGRALIANPESQLEHQFLHDVFAECEKALQQTLGGTSASS